MSRNSRTWWFVEAGGKLVKLLKRRTDGCAGCTEDGRDGRIRATEYTGGNGTRKRGGSAERSEKKKKGRCETYNVGVKDLASAYVLCPHLAECGGLSIYRRDKVLRNNERIGSRVVTQAQIRTEY